MTIYFQGPPRQPKWGSAQSLTPDVQLTKDDVVLWIDVIYEEELDRLLHTHGRPGLLVSTAHATSISNSCQIDYWPRFLLITALELLPSAGSNDHWPVTYCANFLINKKQINRYLLLKLIKWFKLSSYTHTWSGLGDTMDLSRTLTEFDHLTPGLIPNMKEFRSHMLCPVQNVETKFVGTEGMIKNDSNIENYGSNKWTWDSFLGSMVSQSAVSLITESIRHEKYMVYTEKTLYAIHGLTFPIWVGGYAQADVWRDKGFDVFDDVIDHSYQYCDTLLERCTRAISDNLKILTNLEFAREQKLANLDRLRRNREQLLPIFKQQHDDFWRRAPVELWQARPLNDELAQLLIQNGFGSEYNK